MVLYYSSQTSKSNVLESAKDSVPVTVPIDLVPMTIQIDLVL